MRIASELSDIRDFTAEIVKHSYPSGIGPIAKLRIEIDTERMLQFLTIDLWQMKRK